ncbi:MAG TPA: GntR family transcriptional regulator [Casimicrobiaceae bacterium]|jgi:GntR family transcriptional regulator|nr:GntR family transcriptional regulator [Casimicrobiaceae bacterium]
MSVPVPKYYLVTNVLRQTFAKYERGDRVPSEHELAAQFGVSRVTLQRALSQLVDDGIVVRLQGKGTFYAGEGKKGGVQAISGALESLMIYENGASARVIGKSCSREAPPDVRHQLGLGPSDEVVSFKRVAIVDAEPLAYIVNYLPRDVGMKIYDDAEALTHSPIAYLLREKYGISLTRAEQTIDAVLAEPEVASALDFPIGSPLLRIERTLFTRKERPIQFTRSWYRSDRHKYAVTLSDWGGSPSRKKQRDLSSLQDRRGSRGTAGPRPLNLG